MIKSNPVNSDKITNIERFEKKYYNHTKKMIQNGGNSNINKLNKNIQRLYNCYVLSQNQNGGVDNELSLQIKKRLDKKIAELNELEGGLLDIKAYITNIFGNEKSINIDTLKKRILTDPILNKEVVLSTIILNTILPLFKNGNNGNNISKEYILNSINNTGAFFKNNLDHLNPLKWGQ